MSAETHRTGLDGQDRARDNAPGREHVVYAITHIPSGRRYIGRTINEHQRIYTHRSNLRCGRHWCPELQQDWNREGPGAFRFEILERKIKTEQAAREAEFRHISLNQLLYNYRTAVDPKTGTLTLIDQRRVRQSVALKAAWRDSNTNLRTPRRTRWDDPKQRKVQSLSQKRRYSNPAERIKTAKATRLAQTDDVRRRKSEAAKASWADPTSNQRLAKRTSTKKATKARLKARWADPAARQRQSEKIKMAHARRKLQIV